MSITHFPDEDQNATLQQISAFLEYLEGYLGPHPMYSFHPFLQNNHQSHAVAMYGGTMEDHRAFVFRVNITVSAEEQGKAIGRRIAQLESVAHHTEKNAKEQWTEQTLDRIRGMLLS